MPVLRCGALMRPADGSQRDAVAALAANAERNGVEVVAARRRRARGAGRVGHRSGRLHAGAGGGSPTPRRRASHRLSSRGASSEAAANSSFREPGGESVRRPARRQLRRARGRRGGAARRRRLVRGLPAQGRVPGLRPAGRRAARADPAAGARRSAPRACWSSRRSTARWWRARPPSTRRTRTTGRSVPRPRDEILPKATAMYPPLEDAEPVAAYAGLRPAGRGVNYLIGPSGACPGLVNVAAIRSTGLTASLGIAERVCAIVGELGVALGPERPLEPGPASGFAGPWWRRTAEYRAELVGRDADEPAARHRRGHLRRQGGAVRRRPAAREGGAAREGARHPKPGWVEQDAEEVLATVVGRGRRAAAPTTRGDRGLRARPPGRVGAGLGRRQRPAR